MEYEFWRERPETGWATVFHTENLEEGGKTLVSNSGYLVKEGAHEKNSGQLCTFIEGMILFSVFREKERIRYGEDVNLMQAEFPAINGIERCHDKTEIIGNPYFDFIGPTNYHFTAVVIISDDEMEMIAKSYPGEKRHKLKDEEEISLTIEQDTAAGENRINEK